MGLSILLALTALGYTIIYPIAVDDEDDQEDLSLKNEMIWLFSFVIWCLNAFLIRNEYKKLGYTTNYLRIAWIIFLINQTILLVIGLLGNDDNSTHEFIIIYGLNEGGIIGIIIAGFFFSDDSAAQQYSETYLGLVDDKKKSISIEPVINMTNANYSPSSNSKKRSFSTSEDFKPFIQDEPQPGQRRKSSMRNSLSREEKKDSYYVERRDTTESDFNNSRVNTSRTLSLAQVARIDAANITAIGVVGIEEIVRFDKKTTVYQIEFYINGKRFVTKRSYSEFEYLAQEINKTKPEMPIPDLPPKKAMNKDDATINDRKESFERFLKFLTENQIGLGYLSEFLIPFASLPYYGKNTKKDASRLSVPNNSLVSRNGSQRSSKVDSSSLVNGNGAGSLEKNNILTASLKESIERGFDVGENRFKVKFHETYNSDKEDATYYQYILRDAYQNMEWTIRHRYSDFKTLHEELVKRVAKTDRALIPELPNKGNLGFVFKKDPKLIEYRSEALGVFLEKVLNIGLLEEIPYVQEFIRKRNY